MVVAEPDARCEPGARSEGEGEGLGPKSEARLRSEAQKGRFGPEIKGEKSEPNEQ